jgi:hypothetical protein
MARLYEQPPLLGQPWGISMIRSGETYAIGAMLAARVDARSSEPVIDTHESTAAAREPLTVDADPLGEERAQELVLGPGMVLALPDDGFGHEVRMT